MSHNIRLDPAFPERLRSLRRGLHLSQGELAHRAGIHERTIHDFETGKRTHAMEKTLLVLADALGVSFENLMGLEEEGRESDRGAPGANRSGHGEPGAGGQGRPGRMDGERRGFLGRVVAHGVLLPAVSLFVLLLVLVSVYVLMRGEAGGRSSWKQGPGEISSEELDAVQVTTSVPCAYRAYVEGMRYWGMLYREEARVAFKRAIACDSTMAMAWAMLAHPYSDYHKEESFYYAGKALDYSGNVSERERLYIEALYSMKSDDVDGAVAILEALVEDYPDFAEAYRLLGYVYSAQQDFTRAVAALQAAVKIDPEDGMSLNRLAYCYADIGDFDQALHAANHYAEMAPDEANPYDTRGDILSWMGRADEAMESYRNALRRNPRFYPSLQNLGYIRLLRREYGEAESLFRRLLEAEDLRARSRARFLLAAIPLYQGKLAEALELLDRGIDADEMEGAGSDASLFKVFSKALILYERGDLEGTRRIASRLVDDYVDGDMLAGDLVPEAMSLLALVDTSLARSRLAGVGERSEFVGLVSAAWIDIVEGKPRAALDKLGGVSPLPLGDRHKILHPMALASMEIGDYDGAAGILEKLVNGSYRNSMDLTPPGIRLRYLLARSYEELGAFEEAGREYEEFIATWRHADAELQDEVLEARERLRALRSGG